jgi:signal transduction histidine kinase/HPt (histidine-containing phosphotransfer) domain-containing protein
MPSQLRVLIVEDCENDAALLLMELRRGRWDVIHQRVDTPGAMAAALDAHPWDLIIADYSMPNFSGPAALTMARERTADIPFVLVSGQIGEETAVQAMKAGADDYLFKGDLHRLVPAVERELRGLEERRCARTTELLLQVHATQLAEALHLARLGTWNIDLKTDSTDLSEEALSLLGGALRTNAPTLDEFFACFHPDDRRVLNESLHNKEVKQIAQDCRLASPGTAMAFVHIRGNVVRDEQGKPEIAGGMIQDISERQAIDAELLRLKDAAEAANRAKSAFLANMSHELRTPMSAIIGFADLMSQERANPPTHEECVKVIQRNSHHLLQLINEILDLSRIEAGQMTVERIQCDLPALLNDVIVLMRARAAEKSLQFNVAVDGTLPRHIRTDPLKLRQILINLLGNAIKFTAAGAVEMIARCEPCGQNCRISIEIRDTGIGMTTEQMSRVFEPFAQAEQSTTRTFGGSGLGLAISRRLARLLQGDVIVTSNKGAGCVFTASIEAGSVENTETVSTLEDPFSSAGVPEEASHENDIDAHLLLVEDGMDNQRLLSTHLKMAGAGVDIAENGGIAVELASSGEYDLILMDMQMPVMDGYTATAELRRRGMTIPIIALTACAMAEDRDKCLAHGCTDYLTKPIKRDALLTNIRHHLKLAPKKGNSMTSAQSTAALSASGDCGVLRSSIANLPGMAAIVVDFVADLPKQVEQLRSLLETNNLDPLRRLAHQLRGSCGGYGFDAISDLAAAAEESIQKGDSPLVISDRVNSVIQMIRRIEGYDGTAMRASA